MLLTSGLGNLKSQVEVTCMAPVTKRRSVTRLARIPYLNVYQIVHCPYCSPSRRSKPTHRMASRRTATTLLAHCRTSGALTKPPIHSRPYRLPPTATFSSSAFRAATPAAPPPQGFRLPTKERWDERKESSLDNAGKYFLMTEMFRGMYVVLEQFFRPP